MISVPIEERLLHYFLAMGAQSTEQLPNSPPGLSFTMGSDKVHLAILKTDAFAQRNSIVETLLGLSSLRTSTNQLYLAAPKLLGTAIDSGVFRSHGIGLILFDDRRIEEVVPPQPIQVVQAGSVVPSQDPALVTELATLKSMYFEMEQTISKMRDELRNFQRSVQLAPSRVDSIPSASTITHATPRYTGPEAPLPSFFTNNPWLDVLSKRGREDGGPLAG